MGAFTIDMAAFFLPGIGLFWLILGLYGIFTAIFFLNRRTEENADSASGVSAHSESSPPTKGKPNLRQSRPRAVVISSSFLLVLVGYLSLWFSELQVGAKPIAVSQPPETESQLAEIVTQTVEREFDRNAHVGMIVGAVADGEEILLGFGNRRVGESEPVDADTVFEIGSISKTFTGILLAKRVENGDLNLDDPIVDLLPEGWKLSKAAQGITLRHLTTHTSGLPRLPPNLLGLTTVFKPLFGGDPYRHYTEENLREALETVELDFAPGTDRTYSNFAVGLLGFLLATHNGTDYETLLQTELCGPLGMERTASINDDWHLDHFAEGYRTTAKAGSMLLAMESDQWLLPNPLAGAGGIRSTGTDMMKFLKANMGLVSTPLDAAIELSHEEIYKENDFRSMGMNWIRDFEDDLSQNILWHNGG
ncbi:MAG: beta-lactamase family protein, partial [Candidatus Omnitrophica bacterium]|nr:beta-lactamase family protein [Candidatus Omnitrophota bacterium]